MQITARQQRFRNSRLKIKRAMSHWSEFARTYNEYVAGEPFKAEVDKQNSAGIGSYTITRVIPIPDNISPIIGDIIHNLRIALDYMAVDLAKENHVDDENSLKSTYFPISIDEQRFNKDGRKKIKSCSLDAQAAIESLQPFKDGMQDLYALHTLDLIDKHNSIIPVGAASLDFGAQFSMTMEQNKVYNGAIELGGIYEKSPPKFPICIGDVVGRITDKTSDVETATGHVTFQIVFHDTGPSDGFQVAGFLEHLINMVNWIVDHVDQNVSYIEI